MVAHIVNFSWIADATAEQVDSFSRALEQMAAELNELAVILHGLDLHFRADNGDHALIATCANEAGWDAYQVNPLHRAFVSNFVNRFSCVVLRSSSLTRMASIMTRPIVEAERDVPNNYLFALFQDAVKVNPMRASLNVDEQQMPGSWS